MKVYKVEIQVESLKDIDFEQLKRMIEATLFPDHRLTVMKPREGATHALFMGYFCYPKGGRNDLKAFGTPEQLVEIYANYFTKPSVEPQECWGHIVDLHTMQIVMETEGGTVWQVVKAGV